MTIAYTVAMSNHKSNNFTDICFKYVFTQNFCHKQDVAQGQFLRGICIYPTLLSQTGCDTRSTSLNSEFSFTKTGCHTDVKKLR